MAEEILEQQNTEQEPDYIQQIEDLRANSVSKADYDKLKAEHNRAMNALINGGQMDDPKAEKVDKDALRKELFSQDNGLSNLEVWQKTLTLRQAIIDDGGNDPFLPQGQKIAPTAEDVEAANRVAKVVQECIDYADGDSRIFTNELDRRTIDTASMTSRRRR
jgi:hypothetical protein